MKKDKKRYAAMMLFQFRTVKNGISNRKRVCEERIILFEAENAKTALLMARQRGKKEEFSYDNRGIKVFFEFVGVIELVELGVSLEEDEVWYRLIEKIEPMERKDKLIPDDNDLIALKPILRKKGRVLVP